jgi:Heparinase II/III-like protein
MKRREFLKTTALGSAGIIVAGSIFASDSAESHSTHPQILVATADRESIKTKVEKNDWAKVAYAKLKTRTDELVQRCQSDPQFMSSRLFMNWQTHYTVPVVRSSRWTGGEGHAPVPTPRFGGARDWATKYEPPARLEDLKPLNDNEGKVWLLNKETGSEEWADAGQTGRMFETVNERIIQTAADAAFIYWLTGDERYANYASEILWTYMYGFSFVQPPKLAVPDPGLARIIGFSSFEVIHEDIVTPLAECYDFLYDFLKKHGKDVVLIQNQLKRMADRVIDGGGREGNWNLNQARIIAFAGLALEVNGNYPDGKGRPYYIDTVLNCRLPAQTGLTHVIKEGYDRETAIWPEGPGYSFDTTADIVRTASLMSGDPAGQAVLADPILPRAVMAQIGLIYPNGFATGLGDTVNPRLNTVALELLIADARRRSDAPLEDRLTAALQREISSGNYDRSANANLIALTKYVAELKQPILPSLIGRGAGGEGANTGATALTLCLSQMERGPQSFFGKPLNVLFQRNDSADGPDYSMAAAMFGTAGGHVHANGLAIELYGAGLILGADPGRGSSYWQADHAEYYSQPPAHNTVIVNGKSSYRIGRGQIAMDLELIEPASGEPALSPNMGFAQAAFRYTNPEAQQQRTLALVRTGTQNGFYFDVFRSRAKSEADSFHDYLYHNIGQSLAICDSAGKPLALAGSDLLGSKNGTLKGYDYFKNERSVDCAEDWRATFTTKVRSGPEHLMALWMPGAMKRRVFALNAPANHAGRKALPPAFADMPMPTVLVRQQGDAWQKPFVAVYEPYLNSDGSSISAVRTAKVEGESSSLAACVVECRPKDKGKGSALKVLLAQDDKPAGVHSVEGCNFQGSFGVIMMRDGAVSEVFLGHGQIMGDSRIFLTAIDNAFINASLLRDENGWLYSSSASINAGMVFKPPSGIDPNSITTLWREDDQGRHKVEQVKISFEKKQSENPVVIVTCTLPPGRNSRLTISS